MIGVLESIGRDTDSMSITVEPEDHEESHTFGAANTLLLVTLLMFCILSGFFLQEKKIRYLPESGASMLLGMIIGLCIRFVSSEDEIGFIKFNPTVFFFILLPPIIFEAGYTLKKKRFFANVTPILLYAVGGTFLSTAVIAIFTYTFAKLGVIGVDSSSPLQSLLFGTLISSVDPVATLAILGSAEANCDPLLYSLIFGESVLNDAVAIVLFHVMNSYSTSSEENFDGQDFFNLMLNFFTTTVCSVIIGVLTGLFCSFLYKRMNLEAYHAYEIQLLFLFSFGCFALAELVSMSGVVSLFFCALTLAHYNYYNLSIQSQISSVYVFEALAKISETMVFAYMGITIFTSRAAWSISFLFIGIALCILGRAVNIFPMSWLANLCRVEKISFRMQQFMFFSGLRGAVGYALSEQIGSHTGSAHGIEIIRTTTQGIVIFTTFFMGGTTSILLEMLNLRRETGSSGGQLREDFSAYHTVSSSHRRRNASNLSKASEINSTDGAEAQQPLSPHGDLSTDRGTSWIGSQVMFKVKHKADSSWRHFDDSVLKPMFGGKGYQKSHLPPEVFNAIFHGSNESPDDDASHDASHSIENPNFGAIHSTTSKSNEVDDSSSLHGYISPVIQGSQLNPTNLHCEHDVLNSSETSQV